MVVSEIFHNTAQQPKWQNSCTKMWPIEQLYIELGFFMTNDDPLSLRFSHLYQWTSSLHWRRWLLAFLNVKICKGLEVYIFTYKICILQEIQFFFWKYKKVGRIQSSCSKKAYYKKNTLVLTQRRREQLQSYSCGVWSKHKNACEIFKFFAGKKL